MNWKGLLLTWGEWHMIVCGLGDGLALRKGETIPKLEDVVTQNPIDERDFYAILATEAWYYKISFGFGRMAWLGFIALILWGAGVL